MPANLEYQLLSNIIDTQDFNTIQKARITEDYFLEALCRQVFQFIQNHHSSRHTYGSVPSWEIVLGRYPAFQRAYTTDTSLTLCEQLRQENMKIQLKTLADQLYAAATGDDPREGLEQIRHYASFMSSQHESTQDLLMADAYEPLRQEYELVSSGQGLLGIPWPWEVVNDETQGMQKGQFIVLYGRPKMMKCVCEGEKIMMEDGSLLPIEQVPENTTVPSYTDTTGQLRWAKAKRVHSGIKTCAEVATESGLRLRTSTEHLYMVPGGGYRRLNELKPGDYIATARKLPDWAPSSKISTEDAHLLGLLVGDGNYTRNEVQFTSEDEEIVSSIKQHVLRHNAELVRGSRDIEYRIKGTTNDHKNGVLDLLRTLGIHGKKSTEKTAPEELFRAESDSICAFLAGLMDTDGHVSSNCAVWYTSSPQLAKDIQHLLMRIGIRGRLKEIITNYNTIAYQIFVLSKEQHHILEDRLGKYLALSRKRLALSRLSRKDVREKRNVDTIPYSDNLLAKILLAKDNKAWPHWGTSKMDASKLFRRTGRISRHLLKLLAKGFESETLTKEAQSDIIWEKIESIEDIGEKNCYDICITDGGDPNFVVQGFVVHNTWVGLAIAAHAYLMARQRVLVVSMEMKSLDIQRRAASVCAKVDYQKLRKATLQPSERDRFFQWLQFLRDSELHAETNGHSPAFLATSGMGSGIGMVQAKIRQFQPDLVVVDGLYRMKDDRTRTRSIDWKNVTNVVQDLNETAKSLNIPIIGITQANRAAAKSAPKDANVAEMAYADALGQECDMAIRVLKEKDPQTHEPEVILSFPASREYEVDNVVIHGIPGTNFGYKRAYVPMEKPAEPSNSNNKGKTLPNGGRVAPRPNFAAYSPG